MQCSEKHVGSVFTQSTPRYRNFPSDRAVICSVSEARHLENSSIPPEMAMFVTNFYGYLLDFQWHNAFRIREMYDSQVYHPIPTMFLDFKDLECHLHRYLLTPKNTFLMGQ